MAEQSKMTPEELEAAAKELAKEKGIHPKLAKNIIKKREAEREVLELESELKEEISKKRTAKDIKKDVLASFERSDES
jgi:hypothetical protein